MLPVAIIDYGMGNLDSVARAIEECHREPLVTNNPDDLEKVSHIILPGVGSFKDGMHNIRELGLASVLRHQAFNNHIPFLGICLGMQLLATMGFEGGRIEGLDFIPGEVKRLQPVTEADRIPHICWNEVIIEKDSSLFDGIRLGGDFYFVHSYHFIPGKQEFVVARTPYCGDFVSVISSENIFGVQFHPEKSMRVGLMLLKNFLNYS